MRWRWPPDSWWGQRPAMSARPTSDSVSRARASRSAFERPVPSSPKATLSSTRRQGSRRASWKTRATGRRPVSDLTGIRTVPAAGAVSPASTRSRVDLPTPDGPTTAVKEPRSSSAVKPDSTGGAAP